MTLDALIARLQDIRSFLDSDADVFLRNLADVGDEDMCIGDFEIQINAKQVIIL